MQTLRLIFQDIEESGLLLSARKLVLFKDDQINVLGFTCKPDTFSPMAERTNIFRKHPTVLTKHELHSWLGSACYLLNFVPNLNRKLASLFKALTRTKHKYGKINLTTTEEQLFREVCNDLANCKDLYYMRLDVPIQLLVDSSRTGVGVLLRQEVTPGEFRPIMYYSKLFSRQLSVSHCAWEWEILGLLTALTAEPVQYFLRASPFPIDIWMDNKACIIMLSTLTGVSPSKYTRWAAKILSLPFAFNLSHRSNKFDYSGPDYLSRITELFKEEPLCEREDYKKLSLEKVKLPDFEGREKTSFNDLCTMLKENPSIVDNVIGLNPTTFNPMTRKNIKKFIEKEPTVDDSKGFIDSKLGQHAEKLIENNEEKEEDIGLVENNYASFSNLKRELIINEQAKDLYTQSIISNILLNEKRRATSRFRLLNGALLVRLKDKRKPAGPQNYQIVLPFRLCAVVAAMIHSLTHCGSKRLVKLFLRHFYSKDVVGVSEEISVACKICTFYARQTGRFDAMHGRIQRDEHTLLCDHVRLPAERYNKIKRIGYLNIIDSQTGYSFARMCKTLSVTENIEIIRNALANTAGRTRLLISDNYRSLVRHNMCKGLNVQVSTGIAFSLGGKGIIESANAQLNKVLLKLSAMLGKTWAEVFTLAVIVYNSLPGGMLGKSDRSRRELYYKTVDENPFDLSQVLELTEDERRIDKVRSEVNEMIRREKLKRKIEFDKEREKYENRTIGKKIEIGTLVYVQKFQAHKWSNRYRPSIFQVTARKNLVLYVIPIVPKQGQRVLAVHVNQTKVFTPRLSRVFMYLPPELQNLLGCTINAEDIIAAKSLGIIPQNFSIEQFTGDFPVDICFSDQSGSDIEELESSSDDSDEDGPSGGDETNIPPTGHHQSHKKKFTKILNKAKRRFHKAFGRKNN